MNNITVILREPQTLALDAIERLQRWWEESEALEPDSRSVEIPVIYGGAGGPDLAAVARHSGLSEKQVVELHASVEYVVWFLGFQPGFPILGIYQNRSICPDAQSRACRFRPVLSASAARRRGFIHYPRRAAGSRSASRR